MRSPKGEVVVWAWTRKGEKKKRRKEKKMSDFFIVPGGRIELPWIAPHDFESCASTNSAIPA